jgi:tetratricopeptide (TPR) repeat protein
MNNDQEINKRPGEIANSTDLSKDPEYPKLLDFYQNAEFAECRDLLEKLEKRYPEDPALLNFRDDLQMKLSLKTIAGAIEEGEKHKKKRKFFNMSVFAVISTLVILAAFAISFFFLDKVAAARQLEIENTQLASLYNQAEQLLLAGQPQPAAAIIERIKSINPAFENLQVLASRTETLLQMESKYQEALKLAAENRKNEALIILYEIETESSGLWDVSQQIASIETSFQIEQYILDGNTAYQDGDWDGVISAFENALKLDPELDDPLLKEQLLKGYLNKIISMLEKENNTVEDIERAEEYYRRAVSMTPQSKAFASDRGNLQKVISELLEQKFAQIATVSLEDKNQTVTSIAKAVTYIRKAANINPESTYLQTELKNAGYYQMAFKHFIEMNWGQAITNLELIMSMDKNYANGNARLLLFEAYHALGKQYSSLGLYLDAFNVLEQAEILAFQDLDNLMKLLQVQVFLGDTLGKTGDFRNAVSYYQYVLNAINANQKLINFPLIYRKLSDANILAASANYEGAYAAYQEVLQEIEVIYSISEIEIGDGVCLAFFASEHLSTVDAILAVNNLPKNMVITFGRNLQVPMILK